MITLQEISGYLPYEPLFSVAYIDDEDCMTCPIKLTIDRFAQYYQDKSVSEFLLYLHFLFDINNPIEVNEKTIIPGEKLSELMDEQGMGYNDHYFNYETNNYEITDPLSEPYFIVRQLLEWHFWIGDQDRFGKDIIDINTMK